MTIPAAVDRVGWYRFGPAPGDWGSAVIAGHVDDREQGLGAMAPLRDAAAGDEVTVTDAAGTTAGRGGWARGGHVEAGGSRQRAFTREGPPPLELNSVGWGI